jgi:hypothetical protein
LIASNFVHYHSQDHRKTLGSGVFGFSRVYPVTGAILEMAEWAAGSR